MTITIKDLARLAGVSVTTVSRALNGYKDIHPETRKRVLKLVEKLNFQPSAVARSLVMKKSQTLGLIISEFGRSRRGHHFLFDIIYGINDQASMLGYDLIFSATSPKQQKEVPYMELCHRRQLDGVILVGARIHDPYLAEVLDSSIPCVLIDVPLVSKKCSHITVNNKRGAMMAVQHLIDGGHQKIGFINGHQEAFVSVERLSGFQEVMQNAGLSQFAEAVYFGDFDEESGRIGARNLLNRYPDLTAIFCASDWMAIGAIRELEQLGKKVPEDISVIGFDDIEMAEWVHPSLTTVYQPRYQFGIEAVGALVRLLQGSEGEAIVLDPSLVIRESSHLVNGR